MITRFVAAGALACAVVGAAHAGPLADALARGDAAAIAALRAQAGDGARCTLGAIYAHRRDLTRAGLYLAGCDELALPDDIAAPVAKLARETRRALNDSDLASIHVVAPAGAVVECTALPGEPFAAPATLWVKPGRYGVSATIEGQRIASSVVAQARKRSPIVLARPVEKQRGARDRQVDFDDEAIAEQQTAPPPPQKHGTLIPKQYRPALAARDPLSEPSEPTAVERPDPLIDPLAATIRSQRAPRRHWIGARVGGGMFDDGRAAARAGGALAVTGRYAPRDWSGPFLSGRLDWTRRGGDPAMGASDIDALAASAGAGLTILDRGALALAVLAQLRGELRLDTARAGEAVSRAGLGAAAGLELALPATPITAGVRFEQGITELVAGARDRAILLELGVDWR